MSNLKKITVKTVCGRIVGIERKPKETLSVMRVVGIARRIVTGESDYGAWIKLKGEFHATNLLTGEEFHSSTCMLPEVASDLVENALADENNKSVEFGFDITVGPSDTPIGYEYGALSLIAPSQEDPLQKLLEIVNKLAIEDKSKVKEKAA